MLTQVGKLDHIFMIHSLRWRVQWLTPFMRAVSFSATKWGWGMMVAVLWLHQNFSRGFIGHAQLLLNATRYAWVAWFGSQIVKGLFERLRPPQIIEGFHSLVKCPKDTSFPSAHAATTTAMVYALLMQNYPHTSYFLIWAVLVSFSRIYLGVHFLTDILAGVLFGAALQNAAALI